MKKRDKLISLVIKECLESLSESYKFTAENKIDIKNILNLVPKRIKCQYIFPSGKRKGDKCNEVFCCHHNTIKPTIEKSSDDYKSSGDYVDSVEYILSNYNEDDAISKAINLSIMEENINTYKKAIRK